MNRRSFLKESIVAGAGFHLNGVSGAFAASAIEPAALKTWRRRGQKSLGQRGADEAAAEIVDLQESAKPKGPDFYMKRMVDLIRLTDRLMSAWKFTQNILYVGGFLAAVLAGYVFLLYPATPQAWGGGKPSCVKLS